MKLCLKFKNIVDAPMCAIIINNQELYRGEVLDLYDFDVDVADGVAKLQIDHWDKKPSDTVVENNVIVRDRSFELDTVIIDNYNIEELIWKSQFYATDGNVYKSCLFFGPNGSYVLNFYNPVLYWILQTRHQDNNNDPEWEQDYNYYIRACKILKQISTR
jgi:hypothetical protein